MLGVKQKSVAGMRGGKGGIRNVGLVGGSWEGTGVRVGPNVAFYVRG